MRRTTTTLCAAAGAFLALILPASAGAAFGPLGSFGGPGSADGQFNHPQGAVTVGSGQIDIADSGNARIQQLSTTGALASGSLTAPGFAPTDVALDAAGTVFASGPAGVRGWPLGLLLVSFQPPGNSYGIAVVGGNIFVSDAQNGVIRRYNTGGGFELNIGNGRLNEPLGMTSDAAGTIYVADPGNGRIVRFDTGGNEIGQWLMPSYTVVANGQTFKGTVEPHDVAVDDAGRVYAPDAGPHSNLVAVFGPGGDLQQLFGSPDSDPGSPCPVRSPQGLAAGAGGLFVSSTGENAIRVFSESVAPCPEPNFGPGGGVTLAGPNGNAKDKKRPKVKIRGVPGGCARHDFSFRIHATDDGVLKKLLLFINHKRIAKQKPNKDEWTVKVNMPVSKVERQLPRGSFLPVLIQVKVVDGSGKKARASRSFRICG
jgi:hypothetical protein